MPKHYLYDENGVETIVSDTPDPPKSPKALSFRDFMMLAMTAGGVTPAKYADAKADPALAIYFDLLQQSEGIKKNDQLTQMGAQAFVDAGVITEQGRDAIFAAWPTE